MDINGLVDKMTLEEKLSLLAGVDLWHTAAIDRLGIPSVKVTDGPNGARGAWGDLGPTSALFPVGTALAATWNTELIERTGAALAAEVKAKEAQVLLGPTVNIHRTPLGGRGFECYSEDPYLSGKMAAAYIRGLQNEGISACIKHFVCNDQEYERFTISTEVDERTLREIYLEPFRIALAEARPWSLMSSYNRLNGTYASENAGLLRQILEEEWGFDGMVMSDWKGTYSDNVPQGGLDLEMPGPGRYMSPQVVRKALESGALSTADLDDKVGRILRWIERVGAFEHPVRGKEKAEDTPEQRAFMRSLAQETIVLLKNHGQLLPLDPARIKKIAVIGELADRPNAMGGGSSHVSPHYLISPLEGIQGRAGSAVQVQYALGCMVHRLTPGLDKRTLTDEYGNPGALTLRLFDNLEFSGTPGFEISTDRSNVDWWGPGVPGVDQDRFCATLSGTFTPLQGGNHTFAVSSAGQTRLWLDGHLLIDNWYESGSRTEKRVQKSLWAGQPVKLRVEFRWSSHDDWRFVRVGHLPPAVPDPIGEAVKLAQQADAVVVVAGLTSDWESESFDRVNMHLPRQQDQLIEALLDANPNTVVVLNTGSPVTMPWADRAPVIMQQWYNSQECGNALADVIFGDVNPSGKLPTTFPRRYEDNPTIDTYPGQDGRILYSEGVFVGYRHYDSKSIEPLFPFGHGLSYTTFEYSNLRLSASQLSELETLEISLDVRNTGARAGKEIVQLYVHDAQSTFARPEQELKAFTKVELQPGETKTVQLRLGREAFRYYDVGQHSWRVEPGEFEIRVGRSSRDLPLRAVFNVKAASEGQLQQAAGQRGSAA